jgi:hypothetical protein
MGKKIICGMLSEDERKCSSVVVSRGVKVEKNYKIHTDNGRYPSC